MGSHARATGVARASFPGEAPHECAGAAVTTAHRFSTLGSVKARDVSNPLSRFRDVAIAYDEGLGPPPAKVTLLEDRSRSILSRNDSPDLSFRWSANPYRGCLHACAYCYARPTHEYLDLGAGTDFDTKIVVKRDAPELLREAFDKPSWQGELVMFSGVTDCYQAIEKDLELTRRCLEVCLEYRNPVSVISKSALVERDIDLFVELAREARFHIAVSLAFSDNELSRTIEPWAASPDRRLKVIEKLAAAGLAPSVMVAPVIPGVNDSQLVTVLERAVAAGAVSAGWTLLRLPHAVKDVFEERLRVAMPLAADKVLHRIRETRGGEKLYDASFATRARGVGPYADTLAAMFDATCQRLGLDRRDEAAYDDRVTFRRPAPRTGQLSLF